MRTSASMKCVQISLSVVIAGLLAGCGQEESRRAEPPTAWSGTPTVGPFDAAGQIELPLDGYLLTGPELREVTAVRDQLVSRCVERFTQRPYVPATAVGVAPAFSDYRFGIVGTTRAGKFGYHDPQDELSVTWANAHPVDPPDGKPTADFVLTGVLPAGQARPKDPSGAPLPTDGCSGESERNLGGADPDAEAIAAEIEAIQSAERTDPQVKEAIADWSACMRKEGYDYANPLDPVVEFGAQESITDRELTAAMTDASCRVSTAYVERRVQVLSAIQEESLAANRALWARHRDEAATRLRNARGYATLYGLDSGVRDGASDSDTNRP